MKKNPISLFSIISIALIFIAVRFFYIDLSVRSFQWDSLGYYMYLPAQYIYGDVSKLEWYDGMKEKYDFPGDFYQAKKYEATGNYVFFYTMGVSILQTPFFFVGHMMAKIIGCEQDGFSLPYHIAINFGMLIYFFTGLLLLRKIMIKWFTDFAMATAIVIISLATNLVQYVSIEGGFTHGYLFFIYCVMLYSTVKWHERMTLKWSFIIGLIAGLATIIRVTDAIIVFIPILWGLSNKEVRRAKWSILLSKPSHIIIAVVGVFIMLLPQIIYWWHVSGHLIYPMGSKWNFFNPHFRVLFGWEKGWFVYTPVTLILVASLFFMNRKDYKFAILTFVIINLWIIIAWHQWRYAASYSTRALVQSLAVIAIPFADLISSISKKKFLLFSLYAISSYLIFVNLFQVWQYNKGIIHFDHMNKEYYQAIYLNSRPTASQLSLLDTDEIIYDEKGYDNRQIIKNDSSFAFDSELKKDILLFSGHLENMGIRKGDYLKISLDVASDFVLWDHFLIATIVKENEMVKQRKIRMAYYNYDVNNWNRCEFYFLIDTNESIGKFELMCSTNSGTKIFLKNLDIKALGEQITSSR
jgi:hypothetical protein